MIKVNRMSFPETALLLQDWRLRAMSQGRPLLLLPSARTHLIDLWSVLFRLRLPERRWRRWMCLVRPTAICGRRTRNRANGIRSLVRIDENWLIARTCSRQILRDAINLDSRFFGFGVVTCYARTVLWRWHLRIRVIWCWSKGIGAADIMELAWSVVGLASRWRWLHKRLRRLVQLSWLGRLVCPALPSSTTPDTERNSDGEQQDSDATNDGNHYNYRDTRMACRVRHVCGRTGTTGHCRCCI